MVITSRLDRRAGYAVLDDSLVATDTDEPGRTVPRYRRLANGLRQRIVAGERAIDGAIPAERDLVRSTGLSQITVRGAIAALAREGLLRRGRGTFVVATGVAQDIQGVYSFTERGRAQGRTPSNPLRSLSIRPATDEEATMPGLEPGEAVVHLLRQHLVDGQPVMLDAVRLPFRRRPALAGADVDGSLYAFLADHGLPPLRSTDTITAVAAPDEVGAALGVDPGTPLSLMRRLAVIHDDVPMEWTEEYGRPDACRYVLHLVAEGLTIKLVGAGIAAAAAGGWGR